jgi:hypothetical protein
MYIEFQLSDITKNSASHILMVIERELEKWSQHHNIAYRSKTVKLTHRVTFDDDNLYSFFGITWNPKSYAAQRWRFVVDLNNKTSFDSSV